MIVFSIYIEMFSSLHVLITIWDLSCLCILSHKLTSSQHIYYIITFLKSLCHLCGVQQTFITVRKFVDYYNFLRSVSLLRVEFTQNISHIHCLQGIFPGRIFWYPMRTVLWLKNHPYTVISQDFIFYINYLLYSDLLQKNFLCTLSS